MVEKLYIETNALGKWLITWQNIDRSRFMIWNRKGTASCSRRFVLGCCVMRPRVTFFTDSNGGLMRALHLTTPICDAGIIITYIRTMHLCYSYYKCSCQVENNQIQATGYLVILHSLLSVYKDIETLPKVSPLWSSGRAWVVKWSWELCRR